MFDRRVTWRRKRFHQGGCCSRAPPVLQVKLCVCVCVYPVCSLYGPHQRESSPHVNVPVQSAGVRELVFGRRDAQDGLQVARFPKNPSLRSQSVATQSPKLRTQETERAQISTGSGASHAGVLSRLSTASSRRTISTPYRTVQKS